MPAILVHRAVKRATLRLQVLQNGREENLFVADGRMNAPELPVDVCDLLARPEKTLPCADRLTDGRLRPLFLP